MKVQFRKKFDAFSSLHVCNCLWTMRRRGHHNILDERHVICEAEVQDILSLVKWRTTLVKWRTTKSMLTTLSLPLFMQLHSWEKVVLRPFTIRDVEVPRSVRGLSSTLVNISSIFKVLFKLVPIIWRMSGRWYIVYITISICLIYIASEFKRDSKTTSVTSSRMYAATPPWVLSPFSVRNRTYIGMCTSAMCFY